MNLLLLLSALLSALTGAVGGGVRNTAVVSAVSIEAVVAASVSGQRVAATADRPNVPHPTLRAEAQPAIAQAFSVPAHPLYASRRRE